MRDWAAICDTWRDKGYESLAHDEKVFFNVRILVDAVENGGSISYFYNSGADHVDDCIAALDELGAHTFKSEVERIIALFPPHTLTDWEARNEAIDSWDDDDPAIDDLLEKVDARLLDLVADLERRLAAFTAHDR